MKRRIGLGILLGAAAAVLVLALLPLARRAPAQAPIGTFNGIPFGPLMPATCNPQSFTQNPVFFLTTTEGANPPGLYPCTGKGVFGPANSGPQSIWNFNQAAQSQVVTSAQAYYITNSNLNMPATYATPIGAGTTFKWRVAMTKTAAGTGTFQLVIYRGTLGTVADTADATITIGTQSAAADNMTADVTVTWTSATAYYYSVVPIQAAATTTGFGLAYPAAAAQFSGTATGLTSTTASLIFGLGFTATTGTPTIVVNEVQAQAFGVN